MRLLLRSLLFTLFAITLTSVNVFSQSATITTDQPDYAPGSTAIISGSGWQPGETVTLQVLHDPTGGDDLTSPAHQPWTVVADGSGNVSSQWIVPADEDELGANLKLTAVGGSSGLSAEWMFTDGVSATSIVTPTGFATINVTPGETANIPYAFTYSTSGNVSNSTTSITYNVYLRLGGTDYLIAGPVTQTGLTNGTHAVGSAGSPLTASVIFDGAGGNPPGTGGENYNLRVDVIKNNGSNPGSSADNSSMNWVKVTTPSGSIGSVSVDPQLGVSVYGTASTPTFAVSSTRGSNGTISGTYSVSGLPAGVTSGGFAPSAIFTSNGGDPFPGATLTLNVSASVGAGSYDFTVSLSDGGTPATATGTLVVSPRPITVTPDAGQNKTYGDANPTYTYGFTPALIGSDAFTGALSRDGGENVGNYNITQGDLALSSNYTLSFTTGVQFEIKKLTITVTPDAGQNKTYGDANPTYTYGFTPALIGSDAFTGALSRDGGENVGNYNITQGDLALSSNYTLSFTTGVQFEIKKLTITVTPDEVRIKRMVMQIRRILMALRLP